MIKVIELINEKIIIAQIQILETEPKLCFRKAYVVNKIKNGIVLKEYPQYAQENSCLINSNNILTIYDPSEKLLKMYTDLVTEIYIDIADGEDDSAISILNAFYDLEDSEEIE